jgi:hypothetical protein
MNSRMFSPKIYLPCQYAAYNDFVIFVVKEAANKRDAELQDHAF